MKRVAVVFAGGIGSRMNNTSLPKQFLKINDKPIIIYTLEIFQKHKDIDFIVVSCVSEWIEYLKHICEEYSLSKVVKIVEGGSTGQLSIYNGLVGAKKLVLGEKTIVLIHDGVRPFIDDSTISNNIEGVEKYGSSITSSNVIETVVIVNNQGKIKDVLDRNSSKVAKAPQSFWLDNILEYHNQAIKDGITNFIDSCTLMNHYGYRLHYINGPTDNIKITTPKDYFVAKAIIESQNMEIE